MSTHAHTLSLPIRFRHCDPAGIVFYPRFVEMAHSVVEDFFAVVLGFSYQRMFSEFKAGVPVVNLQVDFKAPGMLDENLTGCLSVIKVGQSSLKLRVEIVNQSSGQTKVQAQITIAFVVKQEGKLRSRPWPEPLRAELLRQLGD